MTFFPWLIERLQIHLRVHSERIVLTRAGGSAGNLERDVGGFLSNMGIPDGEESVDRVGDDEEYRIELALVWRVYVLVRFGILSLISIKIMSAVHGGL